MGYNPDDNEGPYGEADRTSEDDRGHTLYGYDDEEDGRTSWYYGDGTLDTVTR